ncbi:MAG: YqgE/AlgH family protein, partial [Chlamydiia bacterium]|nr:YqgE/AlgH family protein [Chlamydiia bacterium]
SSLKRGTLLIATPDISNGLYYRSVILLCEHTVSGSFGLIINKHLELEVPQELSALGEMVNPRADVRVGGPVQTNQMMLVHTHFDESQYLLELFPKVYLGGDLTFLQQNISDASGPEMLICFGYTGWGAGQLEREYLDGNWFLKPADERSLFYTSTDKMWVNLLREMGGRYASLSTIPEDLSVN